METWQIILFILIFVFVILPALFWIFVVKEVSGAVQDLAGDVSVSDDAQSYWGSRTWRGL